MANEPKKIRGPFWTADVEIVKTASPKTAYAFRSLFLELQPRRVDVGALHAPGTVLLLCFVRRVTVNLGSDFVFTRPTSDRPPSPSSSPETLRDLVAQGKLALVLGTIDPSTWKRDWDVDVLSEAVCLAGDMSLDVLRPRASARAKLYAALSVTEAPLGQRSGAARLIGALTVHASGLTAFGRIAVPWETQPLAAPLQVAKEIQQAASAAATLPQARFRITIEEARLTEAERQAWIGSWARFGLAVDPGNPAFQAPGSPSVPAPSWVTMDVGSLDRVPPIFWTLDPAQSPTALPVHFNEGEVGLLLADQNPHNAQRPPTSLARATPKTVSVTRSGQDLLVRVSTPAVGTLTSGTLTYQSVRSDTAPWHERITLRSLTTAWSPVETPRRVREALDLGAPTWDAGDAQRPAVPVTPPVLWGAFKLEDGWAQLPVPNLTEQMYLDAGLAEAPTASARALAAIVRDFRDVHPDFEPAISGRVTGLVQRTLGPDGKPIFAGPNGRGAIKSAETFRQWFTDVPGVNQAVMLPLELQETAPGSGIFAFESSAFFPIDGQLLGNQGRTHNYHFTLELHTTFTYQGGEIFQFAGDDDLWVFIDQRLAVDLGGVHSSVTGAVELDTLGLTRGQTYAFDLFFAERHTRASKFLFQTGISVDQTPPMLQGAVTFGNDKPGVLASRVSEQPWSVVLLDAQSLTGTWTVSMATAATPVLTTIDLDLGAPELVLNGFIWMAPEAPTAEDALPRLDDWRAGLVSLALATVDPGGAFPSPVQFAVDTLAFAIEHDTQIAFPSATLGLWQMRYEADRPVVRAMVDKRLLPDTLFSQPPPLVWRRHGTLPMVQALPLTQSQSPPSQPSSSRQLAPFQLPVATDSAAGGLVLPSGWLFGVQEGERPATSWPRLLGVATPADEWGVDLPMVSLSLPGLILDPKIAAATTGLPADTSLNLAVQLRYDLPYTDELNALAQVPKIPRLPDEVAPSPADRPPSPPRPLARGDFSQHWVRLSEKASLAAADAVTAFAADATGKPEVRGLVEPLAWPVDAHLDTASFPGKLTLANAAGLSPVSSLELSESTALRGISGTFQEEAGRRIHLSMDTAGFDITAGSAADEVATTGEHRDQRGLMRGASVVGTKTIRTRVRLAEPAEGIDLTSALVPFPLQVGAATTWHLWFRDLPCASGSFQRSATLSSQNEDINDPEARTRAFETLSGYEWRLGADLQQGTMPLVLYGLVFVPLTLESVQIEGEEVREVQMIGRLQLPLEGVPAEQSDLANAVRLTFTRSTEATAVTLSGIQAVSSEVEWPLARAGGESGDAPRIVWSQIELLPAGAGLEVRGASVAFSLFDADWAIALAPIVFKGLPTPIDQRYRPALSASEPVFPSELAMSLDLQHGVHTLSLQLTVTLGRQVSEMPPAHRPLALVWQLQETPPPVLPSLRNVFSADVRFMLAGSAPGDVTWENGTLFDNLTLVEDPSIGAPGTSLAYADRTLQFHWTSPERHTAGWPQVLPGMRLRPGEAPGFVTVAFEVLTKAGDVPTLRLLSAFVEELLLCRWGQFLQGDMAASSVDGPRLFGSSAGDVAFGYIGQASGASWDESLLANGVVEITNLISWPLATALSDDMLTVTLPAAHGTAPLSHLRHTARVMLDQHLVPIDVLASGQGDVIFQIAGDKSWQLLAVVEHQLLEVVGEGAGTYRTGADRRLSVVQEVRLFAPSTFRAALRRIGDGRMPSPVNKTEVIGDASFGVWGRAVRNLLTSGTPSPIDALGVALVVEASTLLFVRKNAASPSALVNLQLLPGGTQVGALSHPDDFAPSDPADPTWALLNLPFFGRLQDESLDGTSDPQSTNPPLLQVDPVLQLERRRSNGDGALPPLLLALSSWGDTRTEQFKIAAFDGPLGQQFARLDPLSLEESWFRLHLPATDADEEKIASVLRSLPETPARLGRPVTLARLLDPGRVGYPPRPAPVLQPIDEVGLDPEWRPERLLVWQVIADRGARQRPAYAWHLTAVQLRGIGALAAAPAPAPVLLTHVGVTVLRTNPGQGLTPTSLAVSPFVRIGFREAGTASPKPRLPLVSVELLCLDERRGHLISAARHVWQDIPEVDRSKLIETWARISHVRLCPESPVAIVRERRLREVELAGARDTQVVLEHAFMSIPPGKAQPHLPRRLFKLRSPVTALKFQDGRFGGGRMPTDVLPFEIAPAQVTGVQPLWLEERPLLPGEVLPNSDDPGRWPFGLSAMRLSLQHTDGKRGVAQPVGPSDEAHPLPVTLWWQAPQVAVQYRSALSGLPAAGLPINFRSRAIRALLPVLPDPLVAEIDPQRDLSTNDAEMNRWQPVLPGATRLLWVGGRPGVFAIWRNAVVRQSSLTRAGGPQLGEVLVSGSLPVQHRHPRPVPLPVNRADAKALALRTWASAFAPDKGLLVTRSPADEAYIAEGGGQPEARLALRLEVPVEGVLIPDWTGELTFQITPTVGLGGSMPPWQVNIQMVVGARVFALNPDRDIGDAGSYTFAPSASGADGDPRAALRQAVAQASPDEPIFAEASVAPSAAAGAYVQTLTFPLLAVRRLGTPLPLEPVFAHFEDPEYNRRLTSTTKRASVDVREDSSTTLFTATLSSDREQYNPDSTVVVRYDFNGPAGGAQLFFSRLDASGIPKPLVLRSNTEIPVDPGAVTVFALSELRESLAGDAPRAVFTPGEALRVEVKLSTGGETELVLPIVSEPVVPSPQAAYALLSRTTDERTVQCARFAWGPAPLRIELVNADDLKTDVVRRRAVFHLTDIVRKGSVGSYTLQKISPSGATHAWDPVQVTR